MCRIVLAPLFEQFLLRRPSPLGKRVRRGDQGPREGSPLRQGPREGSPLRQGPREGSPLGPGVSTRPRLPSLRSSSSFLLYSSTVRFMCIEQNLGPHIE